MPIYDQETLSSDKDVTDEENIIPVDDEELMTTIRGSAEATTVTFRELSNQRIEAIEAYNHQLVIPQTTDMSSVQLNIFAPATDILTTHMTKTFCSDKEILVSTPTSDQYIQGAKQLDKMVNHVIYKENNGYFVMNRAFKDAALSKNAVIKVYWDESTEVYMEDYENIPSEQVEAIIMQKEEDGFVVEVEEMEKVTIEVLDIERSMTNFTLRCSFTKGLPVIENVPAEEFMINDGAVAINDSHLTNFVGQRKMTYGNTLKMMFPDLDVEGLPSYSQVGYDPTDETRARGDFDGTTDDEFGSTEGAVGKVYELLESWIRADVDGDGIAEWRHCFSVGNELISNEEWLGRIPFASFAYFPNPHKFWALGLWDKLRDYQFAATGMLRGQLDVIARQLAPQVAYDPRYFDPNGLNSGRPGWIKGRPGFNNTHIQPITSAGAGANIAPAMELLRQYAMAEVGIDYISGQVSKDVEASGNDAAKTALVIDNSSARIEGYAREFADNTMKDIVWQIIKLLVENKDEDSVKQLAAAVGNGQEFVIGEAGLHNVLTKADLTTKVGLGHMSGQQKIAAITALMQISQQLASDPIAPLITPPEAKLQMANELAKGWGFENPAELFGTPEMVANASAEFKQQQDTAKQAQTAASQSQVGMLQLQQQQFQHQVQMDKENQAFQQALAQAESDAKVKATLAKADLDVAKTDDVELETVIKQATTFTEGKVSV